VSVATTLGRVNTNDGPLGSATTCGVVSVINRMPLPVPMSCAERTPAGSARLTESVGVPDGCWLETLAVNAVTVDPGTLGNVTLLETFAALGSATVPPCANVKLSSVDDVTVAGVGLEAVEPPPHALTRALITMTAPSWTTRRVLN
jgi:hypothetical protein